MKHEAIPRLSLGWINLLRPRGTKVLTEIIIERPRRKARATVTNHLLRLLDILLISQPFVHIPQELQLSEETVLLFLHVPRHLNHVSLPGHLLLALQQAELSQRGLQLLPAALHLLLELEVEAAQLLVLLLDV